MKTLVLEKAQALGISDIGVVKAEVWTDLGLLLSEKGSQPMISHSPDQRCDPFRILPGAQSVLVYLCGYHPPAPPENLSRYAMGKDYHLVMREKGQALIQLLEEHGYQGKCFCDNGPLNERYLAWKAGLGFIGENGFLIHPSLGSFVFLAYIVTDCPLPPDKPLDAACAGCGACIRHCPGGALKKGPNFQPERCLSYLTQKKGALTPQEEELIRASGCAWGCDICQTVCPHNQDIPPATLPEFRENLIHRLTLEEGLSNRAFREKYKNRAFSWRGKGVLERNLSLLSGKTDKTK